MTHTNILDFEQIKHIKLTPMPHQLEAFDVYNVKVPRMRLNGFLLAAEVGTGKSMISLTISKCLHAEIVIVLPQNH